LLIFYRTQVHRPGCLLRIWLWWFRLLRRWDQPFPRLILEWLNKFIYCSAVSLFCCIQQLVILLCSLQQLVYFVDVNLSDALYPLAAQACSKCQLIVAFHSIVTDSNNKIMFIYRPATESWLTVVEWCWFWLWFRNWSWDGWTSW